MKDKRIRQLKRLFLEETDNKLFETLRVGEKTAKDEQFLRKLGKFLEIYTGNVNVCMRLFGINEQIKELKNKKYWKDTYY